MALKHYQVVGRKTPTEADPTPGLFRMHLFAPNTVVAKSRFWYFLHQLHKLKRSTGEIVSVSEIREKNPNIVKNYGITIRYNSRSNTHNMYKECRDTTLAGAVEQMYSDLAGRHRARFSSIHIVDTQVVPAGVRAQKRFNPERDDEFPVGVKRANIKQFATARVKFPLAHRIQRAASKSVRSTYAAKRPTTFFN